VYRGMADAFDHASVTSCLSCVSQGLKYRYAGEFTLAALTDFATKMLAKELTPTYKSEAVPEKNDAPVTVVVGDNFDSIVMDPTKDVLLEVYAPW
jgi:hypothetical protein